MSDLKIDDLPLFVDRTCRYGHGSLLRIDKAEGKPVFFAIPYGSVNQVDDGPKYIGPLEWYVCPVCGYTETFDPTPASTIAFAQASNG